MKKFLVLLLVMAAAAPGAMAQPASHTPVSNASTATESVTVTGIKDVEKAVTDFVGVTTVPTRMANRMARWRDGVCPITAGVRPEAVKFVTQHVKDIAALVGAPVNNRKSCQPNIEIVFTTTPQLLADNIRVLHPLLLGYHDNDRQAARMANITHPIQAWYSTATSDLRGQAQIDGMRTGGVTMDMGFTPGAGGGGPQSSATGTVSMNMPGARVVNVTGGRLSDGVASEFNHVVVVVEPAKLLDHEIGTVADYIALLALSQTQQPDNCQELPTILNVLVAGCSAPPQALTTVDLAYLRALYKVTSTANFNGQRGEMVYQMGKTLAPNLASGR